MTHPTVQELLPRLAAAQVLCVGRRGFVSWIVKRVTGSVFSHAALIEQTAGGIAATVEAADLQGVKALRLERYLEDPSVTHLRLRDHSALTPWERQAIMQAAWLRVGKGYDGWQLFGIYARYRLPWLFGGVKRALKRNRLDHAGRLICSELVSVAYQEGAGIRLAPPDVAMGNVTPAHLADSHKLRTVWDWTAG